MFRRVAGAPPTLIGVVHLPALPGNPRSSLTWPELRAWALRDARRLSAGGVDALIVENLGDTPYPRGRSDAATIAAMTRVVSEIADQTPVPVGVNILRNDALGALAVAAASGASFIRVNVLTGAMVTDQGIIQASARELLMERRRLGCEIQIAADVAVKHASPLGALDVEQTSRDLAYRAGADAVIVTGSGTGRPISLPHLQTVRSAIPETPIWAGSGVSPTSLEQIRSAVDAIIVGTYLHEDGVLSNPVDPGRVAAMGEALRG